MADLLNETDREFFRTTLNDLFDTFKRTIIVHKEPTKKISNLSTNVYAAYGDTSTPKNIEFVHNYKELEALVSYLDSVGSQTSAIDQDIHLSIPKGASVRIKVKQEGRDYISNGKTEKIEVDGKSFNIVGKESVKYNFGTKLFVFYLEQVI